LPELWPSVLEELGRIADRTGGALFIVKSDIQYWVASPGSFERTEKFVNENWFWRVTTAARLLAARHMLDF
jgi:hypothetical protein